MVNFIVDIFKASFEGIGKLIFDSWSAKGTYLLAQDFPLFIMCHNLSGN